MGLFDAIASTVGNLTDNVVGMVNQNHQNKVNLRMMREQNAFNAEQAQVQRDWRFYLYSDDALQRIRNYFGTIFGFYGNGLSRIFRMEKINQKNVKILII